MVSDRSWHNGLPRFGGRFKEIRLTQSQPGEDHVLRIGPMSLSGQGFRAGKVKNDPACVETRESGIVFQMVGGLDGSLYRGC
jgi:hypothetical protein